MIVPDFSLLGVPYSPGVYNRTMMSIMEQGNKYRAFLGRGANPYLRSPPPHLFPPPPHLISPPPPPLLGTPETRIAKAELRMAVEMDLSRSSLSSPTTSKTDVTVSPASSDGDPGWSPSSEKSHVMMMVSSEDGEGANEDCDSQNGSNADRKAFKCPQCMYYTDRKNNLKRHIVTMHQECSKTLECCGVMFHSKAALRDHISLFHRGGYRCQICNRNFCRKALLRRHLTVHSGRKDFSCLMCGYATSHKSNLERHQKVHLRRPSCSSVRETCGVAVVDDDDAKSVDTDVVDFKSNRHREKTSNRFVLLPNRIQCTHRASPDSSRTQGHFCRSGGCHASHVELSEIPEHIFKTVANNNNSETSCSKNNSVINVCSDNENMQSEHVRMNTDMVCPRRSTHTRRSRKFCRRRICVTPYKCCDCGDVFSKQGEFHEHVCRKSRESSDTGLSVTTAVRKGQILLMPHSDSKMDAHNNGKPDIVMTLTSNNSD